MVGKSGQTKQVAAGFARQNAKDVLIIPPIRKLLQHKEVYTMLGYPMNKIVPYMENERREQIKKLGKVVPQWRNLAEKIEIQDEEAAALKVN